MLEDCATDSDGFFARPRTTQTTQKDFRLPAREMTEGTLAVIVRHTLVRPPGAQLSYPCYPCCPWLVLSEARAHPWHNLADMRSHTVRLASILIVALTAAVPSGQSKAPVPLQDYGKFETLAAAAAGGLSPDGKWLAYGINRSNRENELRVVAVASGDAEGRRVRHRRQRSRRTRSWLAYAIGQSEAQEEKLRQQKKPIHRKLGTLRLASGDMTTVDGIESFAFNASGTHLAMKRYAPERKDPPEQPAADDAPAGDDAHRPRAGNGPRHDVRQRDRVRVAGEGRAARARDQRRRQDRQRHPALRSRDADRCACSIPRPPSTPA